MSVESGFVSTPTSTGRADAGHREVHGVRFQLPGSLGDTQQGHTPSLELTLETASGSETQSQPHLPNACVPSDTPRAPAPMILG